MSKAFVHLRGRLSWKLLLALAMVALTLLFWGYGLYTNWNRLGQYEWRADFPSLFLAFALFPAGFLPSLYGWHRIMSCFARGTDFRVNAKIYCYSALPRYIPGVVWYVAGRSFLYREKGIPPSTTILATTLETVLLTVSGLTLALLPIGDLTLGGKPSTLILALLIPLIILLLPPVLERTLRFFTPLSGDEVSPRLTHREIVFLLVVYGIAWLGGGLLLYLLANAIYQVEPLAAMIGVWAASGVASFLFAFLGGLGGREATMSVLLAFYVPLPVAIAISLLSRVMIMVAEAFWVVLFTVLLGGGVRGIFSSRIAIQKAKVSLFSPDGSKVENHPNG